MRLGQLVQFRHRLTVTTRRNTIMTTLYDATSIEMLEISTCSWNTAVVATFPPSSIKRPNRTGPCQKTPPGTIPQNSPSVAPLPLPEQPWQTSTRKEAPGGFKFCIAISNRKMVRPHASCIAQIFVSLIILLQYFSTIKPRSKYWPLKC